MRSKPTQTSDGRLDHSLREIAKAHFLGQLDADAAKQAIAELARPDFPVYCLTYAFRRLLHSVFPHYAEAPVDGSKFFYNKLEVFYKGPALVQQGDVLVPHQTGKTLVPTRTSYMLGKVAAELVNDPLGVRGSPANVFEFGVGTGLVGASLLRNTVEGTVRYVGGDIEKAPISFAGKAFQWNGFTPESASLRRGDGFFVLNRQKCLDLVVSNPPYYPSAKAKASRSAYIGPCIALDGGQDGLAFYRRILPEAQSYLVEGGWCVLQVPECARDEVLDLAQRTYPASKPICTRLEAHRPGSDYALAVQAA